MSTSVAADPNQTYADDLRAFTQAFFRYFDAPMEGSSSHPDLLHVRLNPEIAEHFGRRELILRFHQSDVEESELVAFGSRAFDRMIAYLDRFGALTLLRLPRRHAGGEELMRAVQPTNAGIAGLKLVEETRLLYAFNWHITYRADDKREELLTVLLDADGAYVDEVGEEAGGRSYFEGLLADAESVVIERDGDGQSVTPKLPPMTRLRQYAEDARKYAIYHADLQCIVHEREVLPRLHKALSRLKTYYDQQIEEVYDTHDPDGEKRRSLEQDLARKNNEEIENHRLRVQVQLFSYALIQVPSAVAAITLSDGGQTVDVRVQRNLYDGSLVRPRCDACGQETSQIALDRNGHITCDECIVQCDTCQQIYCVTCGVVSCPVCGSINCDECSTECWACGERACADHVEHCPACGDTICLACLATCHACSRRLCRSHMRVDAVAVDGTEGNGASGEPALICPDCAVRCPGCRQYSAQLGTCSASGQRFCENCLVTCVQCKRLVGAGFYAVHPVTGAPHCRDCTYTCEKCEAVTVEKEACAACGTACCRSCGLICHECQQIFCVEHAAIMPGCGHVVCAEHEAKCAIGGESLCPACQPVCPVCERHYCAEHVDICARCRREVCSECVRRSGLCDTCANHDRDGEFVTLVDEPCAGDERVALLLPHYRWMRTRNARYTLYIGRNRAMSAAIIVVENGPDGDEVLLARRLGVLDSKYRERWI